MSVRLTLFFTRGVSLRTWSMVGMLEREVALYRRLVENGFDVNFVTYGDASDLAYSSVLGGIRILCNEKGLPLEQYEARVPALHGRALRTSHILKTNQTFGGDLALWLSRLMRARLMARCGYMWSLNAAREHGEDSPPAVEARRVEEKVFRGADRVVVTTPAMRLNVLERMPDLEGTVRVVPNYVDTDHFRPWPSQPEEPSLIFVGRIAPEKNIESLLKAVQSLPVRLTLIGEGKLRPELQARYASLDGRVTWEGNVPNNRLPEYINRAGIFVLPSLYEGHPKALLEAMGCGIPVIGADSPGIREVLRHRQTGLLCSPDPDGIRSAIEELLDSPSLRREMGQNARDYIVETYALERILQQEIAVLHELIA